MLKKQNISWKNAHLHSDWNNSWNNFLPHRFQGCRNRKLMLCSSFASKKKYGISDAPGNSATVTFLEWKRDPFKGCEGQLTCPCGGVHFSMKCSVFFLNPPPGDQPNVWGWKGHVLIHLVQDISCNQINWEKHAWSNSEQWRLQGFLNRHVWFNVYYTYIPAVKH